MALAAPMCYIFGLYSGEDKKPTYEQNDIRIDAYKKEIKELHLMHEEDSLTIKFFADRVTDAETKLEKFKKRHNEKINRVDSLSGDGLYEFLSTTSR